MRKQVLFVDEDLGSLDIDGQRYVNETDGRRLILCRMFTISQRRRSRNDCSTDSFTRYMVG